VCVAGANLLLYPTFLRRLGGWFRGEPDNRVKEFIDAQGKKIPSGTALYSEALVHEGETVQIMGLAKKEVEPGPDQPDANHAPRPIVLRATDEVELTISSYSPHVVRVFRVPSGVIPPGALEALVA
jgi:hypothetical protein